MLLGIALLLKGHDAPGGGFVAGLSFAAAGILAFTAYGARRFHSMVPVEPDRVALLGGVVLLLSLLAPLVLGTRVSPIGTGCWRWVPCPGSGRRLSCSRSGWS